MARYYGNIGFAIQTETKPGIWEDSIEERPYKGEVIRNGRRYENGEGINDNFTITNSFSIISDAFLYSHIPAMRYLEYLGSKFKIVSVDIDRPRVILSVGGVYVSGDSTSADSDDSGGNIGE